MRKTSSNGGFKTRTSTSLIANCMAYLIAILLMSPIYAQNSEEILQQSIKAHGGMEKWRKAPSISWTREHKVFRGEQVADHYEVNEIIEQGERRAYQKWTWFSDLEKNPITAYDGEDIWSIGWQQPAPPKMAVYFGYYIANLPWVSQDDIVNLSESKIVRDLFPNDEKEYQEIVLTFDGNNEELTIYVDTESKLVSGCKFYFTDGAFLDALKMPAHITKFGPIYTKFTTFSKSTGFVMPENYSAYDEAGNKVAQGTYTSWSFAKAFPQKKTVRPKNGIVDSSSMDRKSK